MKKLAVFALLCSATIVVAAQSTPTTAQPGSASRTIKPVNYRLRGNAVNIAFLGTDLMGGATGEARVEGKKSSVEIDAKFDGLDDPTRFGLEYLTYVLWAVSPQGRSVNLGEIVLDHHSGHVQKATNMVTFGMFVTAEP